jgi:Fic family protein
MGDGVRHSYAETPSIITDPDEKARREAANGLRQFDTTEQMILSWVERPERQFRLRASMVQTLHREALSGLSSFAGNWRPGGVKIHGSHHEPPPAHLVAEAIEDMCEYVNAHWEAPAIHLAAYIMWRLNWIHPFDDGNGRTSRAVSYLVLCVRLGYLLPGTNTIPDQIAADKRPYYAALETADRRWKETGGVDVSELEELLQGMLATQLMDVMRDATGKPLIDPPPSRVPPESP